MTSHSARLPTDDGAHCWDLGVTSATRGCSQGSLGVTPRVQDRPPPLLCRNDQDDRRRGPNASTDRSLPVPRRGLQDAKLIAVRIGQYVPAPTALDYRLQRHLGRSEPADTLDLPSQVLRPQVQMQPVLGHLGIRDALQEELDPVPL